MKQNKQKIQNKIGSHNRQKKFAKGFTLLELLVVVLIIGILAGIALPQYRRAVDKTRFSTMMNIAKALAEANERFYMTHDIYSTNFYELDINIPANRISSYSAYFDWGNCWLYRQRGVFCTNNTNLQNQFFVGYNFSDTSSFKNKFLCFAKGSDQNSRYAKVCESFGSYWQTSSCEILGTCMFYYVGK